MILKEGEDSLSVVDFIPFLTLRRAFPVFCVSLPNVLQFEIEEVLGIRNYSPAAASFVSPAIAAAATGATYFGTSGPRVAALAGTIGFGTVAATYTAYSVLGIPYGSRGFLFF